MGDDRDKGVSGYRPPAGPQFVDYGAAGRAAGGQAPQSPTVPAPQSIPGGPAKRGARAGAVILIVLIVILGGALAAYALVLDPAKALPKAFSLNDLPPKYEATLLMAASSDQPGFRGYTITVAHDADNSSGSPASRTDINLDADFLSAGVELRYVNDVLYAEVTKVPAQYEAYASSFAGHWYSVSGQTLRSLYRKTDSIVKTPAGRQVGGWYSELTLDGILRQPSLSGFGMDGGVPVRIYSVSVDKDALESLVASSTSLIAGRADISSKSLDAISFSPVIVTIDLLSGDLRSVSVSVNAPAATAAGAARANVTVSLRLTMGDFPAGLSVTAPRAAVSLDDYLKSLSASMLPAGANQPHS